MEACGMVYRMLSRPWVYSTSMVNRYPWKSASAPPVNACSGYGVGIDGIYAQVMALFK
jgi:hypothetical protein